MLEEDISEEVNSINYYSPEHHNSNLNYIEAQITRRSDQHTKYTAVSFDTIYNSIFNCYMW